MQVDYGEGFKRQVKRLSKRYRSIKSDIKPIVDSLLAGEIMGDQLTGYEHSLYKVRVKNSDNPKGKSGGYRCIYYLKTETHCTLVTIYSKSDQGDIEADELNKLLREITEKA